MPDPDFLPWSEPALPQAARRLADEHSVGDELALDGVLAVLPGRRAGRRLTELLIEEAERRGLVLTPPETATVGVLPERLYEPSRPLADPVLERHVWAGALRSLDPDRRSAVFPDPPEEDDLPGWTALASVVRDLHRRTAGEGLDFADVARTCREGEGFDDSGRWRVLAGAQRAYRRRLEALGHRDRHDARRRALDDGALRFDREIVLLGVAEMPGVVREMLRAVDAPVRPLVHAPEGRADAFDGLGCVRPEVWREAEIEIPERALAETGRPPSQADEVVRRLSGEGRELAPDEVTVGVPNEEVVPYLEQRFRAYGVPHRYGPGTGLPRTGPYRLLEAVADYLEGARFPDFAELVRHPEVWGRVDAAGTLEAVDEHFDERLPARVPPGRPGGDGPGRRFGEVVRAVSEELRPGDLAGRKSLSGWMEEVLALLRRAYGERGLVRTKPSDRRTVGALEAIRDAAAALARLPGEVDGRCSGPAALRVLLSEVREEEVPPLPDRSAVEMLGWLELHLDDAPVLVVTGLDEDHVPDPVGAHPFLPNALRRRLGLVDDERRYARDAYLLSATLASKEEAHLVVGRRNAEGDPLRPSRLLLATSGRELAERADRLFDDERPAPAPLPRLGVEAAERSRFRSPPEPVIELDAVPDPLRVTDFGRLLRDPYRWVLERHLGLEAVDDRARELDPLQFGVLAHRVLRRFGESPAAASPDPDAVRSRLHRLLEEEAERRYDGALPAVRLQVAQLRARLSDFAAWHAERVRAGWETVAVEVGTPEQGLPLDVDGEPIGVRGRIDRVDRHPETGRWEVLDYKTSARADTPDDRHRKRGEWRDLQLPLYRHLLPGLVEEGALPAGVAERPSEVDLGYVSLSREGTDRAVAPWGADEIASALEAAREVVRHLRSGRVAHREDRDARGGDALGPLLGEGHLDPSGPRDDGGDGRAEP